MKVIQMTHVGMTNSYNIIMGNATLKEIYGSGLNIFSHDPDEDPEYEFLEFMIKYFTGVEMYEECFNVKVYMSENFDKDGKLIEKYELCECDYPSIKEYVKPVICNNCSKVIKK